MHVIQGRRLGGGGGAVGADAHSIAGEFRLARKMFPNSFTKVTTCVQPHNQTDHPRWRSETCRAVNSRPIDLGLHRGLSKI